jgi:hypothetical protein
LCIVCEQLFWKLVHDARIAALWITDNGEHFSGAITKPWVVSAADEEITHTIENLIGNGQIYSELRDYTLFNFSDGQDLKLFIHKAVTDLKLHVNVCLDGADCIQNNTAWE